ncbi:hypothetical protein [Blautia segnis]|uniref:Uncharacterized protein n=1 Tax=Blautia segnis TaxID=2763030 RepID=A0A8I0AJ63_9FIRM|nr:hypothetical protein [Blautia segnis]MBC5651091.1 hypothetical protein [Blautia segnis]
MKEKSHNGLYDRIKELMRKKNNGSDDDEKEEPIRDLAKESKITSAKEKRQAFIDHLREQAKADENVETTETGSIKSREQGIERSRYTKRYEGMDDIPGITDSEIWKTKANFCKDQQILIRHIVEMEAVKMGIPNPKIIFEKLDEKEESLGFYDHDAKEMVINSSTDGAIKHNNLLEVIDTATHELRHSYQYRMLDNPERFPHINTIVKQYFAYEEDIYPDEERQRTEEGFLEYLANALEVDARRYADESTLYYSGKTLSEIRQLKHVIDEPVRNQILLGLRDEVPNGNNPLMAVGNDFDFFKKEKSKRLQQNNLHNKKIIGNEKGMVSSMAGWSGGTDLSEGAQQAAAKQYMMVVQNIQSNCENMIRVFEQRIKEHPYKQLQHVANTFINLHNSDVPKAIKEAIQEWSSSDESFSKLLQDLDEDCSQESIAAAEKLQDSLKEQVDSYFTNISEIAINKAIQVNEEVMREDQAFVDSWLKSLSALKGQWKTRFEGYSEENAIYANMISMVVSTFNNVETVYEAARADITTIADTFKEKRKDNIDRAIKKGENIFSDIKDTRDIFQNARKKKK